MLGVVEGKQVLVEWTPIVDVLVGRFLRRPDGELMVHYTKTLITHVNGGYDAVMYYPVNPWYDDFNLYLFAYKEQGLDKVWKVRSINFFSQRYVEAHGKEVLPTPPDEVPFYNPFTTVLQEIDCFTGTVQQVGVVELAFGDVQGPFLGFAIACAISVLSLVGEVVLTGGGGAAAAAAAASGKLKLGSERGQSDAAAFSMMKASSKRRKWATRTIMHQ